jgi:predicted PurR-regulated permease PerM
MAFPDRRTVDVLLTILLFAAGLTIAYIARSVIVIFAFSILFAYLIDPVVRFLQQHSLFFKNLRGPHVAEAYLALLILVGLAYYGLAPALHRQAFRVGQLPALMESLSQGEIPAGSDAVRQPSEAELKLRDFLSKHHSRVQKLTESIKQFAFAAIGGIFLVPILALFFLSDGKSLADSVIRLVCSPQSRETMRSLADDLNSMLQHYIRAKVTLGGLSFAYCSAVLLILRFPNAVALGLLAGILEFIPVAGWMTSLATAVTVGILTQAHWIRAAALYGFWRLLIDYWIAPRVVGHQLELHPLLAIFTVMVGGAVGGIVGIYLSIPLVAALRIIWHRLGERERLPEHAPGKEQVAVTQT